MTDKPSFSEIFESLPIVKFFKWLFGEKKTKSDTSLCSECGKGKIKYKADEKDLCEACIMKRLGDRK